ncbi:uncharacterized protein LOC135109758 [Scylla paramamosain]|uniref:uncharacterized protein LOC135109758 n=1 Tax=Scylla paramamosain TaxID=85552 RepID=UPI00308304FD
MSYSKETQQERRRSVHHLVLVLLSLCLHNTAATLQGGTYSYDTLTEVVDIPGEGVTRLCVTPLDANTRIKVRHTGTEGARQEVLVKKKALAVDTLAVLEIGVETGGGDKASLNVWLNGRKLQPPDSDPRPTSPTPLQPRTTLLLKGNAEIRNCTDEKKETKKTEEKEKVVLGTSVEMMMVTATEERTVGGEAGGVTGKQEVTQAQTGKVTEEQAVSSPNASQPPPSSASTNDTLETEGPDLEEEDPWWSFMLVLGKVGEVPVLALLVVCLVGGVVVGGVTVCLCSKACSKRRVEYLPVSTVRTHAGHLPGDIVREPKFWDTASNKQRSSGIGSAYSTLNTDSGSHMGTTNSRGTGSRHAGSANNSMDRGAKSSTHNGVNNLGRGGNVSPTNSINGSRSNTTANVLNIPPGSMPRSASGRSWDNRSVEPSPRLQGNSVTRTPSNRSTRSTGSSVNRNTNRSPNIPYTHKLGILTGHQNVPVLQKHNNNRQQASDDDSDDSWYDKPYVSPPLLADNYSVPHVTSTEPVLVEVRTAAASTTDPNAPEVPMFQFGTFKK